MKQTINYAHMAGGLEAAYRSILKHDSLRHLSKEAVEEILLTIDADIKGIEERAKNYADRLKGEVAASYLPIVASAAAFKAYADRLDGEAAAISGAGDFFSEFEGVSNLRDNEDARYARRYAESQRALRRARA
jgi:hypothetical protein